MAEISDNMQQITRFKARYLWRFRQALQDEIAAVKKRGGQTTFLADGRYLGPKGGMHVYSFTADSELRFPDDTKGQIEFRGRRYECVVVSSAGFDVILAVEAGLGEDVLQAKLFTDPWFLLQELQNRLQAFDSRPLPDLALPAHLLLNRNEANPPDLAFAAREIDFLRKEGFLLPEYNRQQQTALGHIAANQVSFIWGPPGTGKTRTLALIALALLEYYDSLLIVAHSNAAVDQAMLAIGRLFMPRLVDKEAPYLRYGVHYEKALDGYPWMHVQGVLRDEHPALIATIEKLDRERQQLIRRSRREDLQTNQRFALERQLDQVKEALLAGREQLAKAEKELLARAQLVGCTFSKATISPVIYERTWDVVLIDEASMAYIPHCAFVAGLAAEKVGVFGDFRQLAPIAQGDTRDINQWLKRDLFAEAGLIAAADRGQPDSRLVMLETQYRMHPDIAAIPSRLFYNSRLRNGSNVVAQAAEIVAKAPEPDRPIAYFDVSHMGSRIFRDQDSHSRFNFVSALLTAGLAVQAVGDGQQVGVATPYNAQARLIHRLLRDLDISVEDALVATVHRFQGAERDVILFDAAESEGLKPGLLLQEDENAAGESSALRLANVAVSRARGKFVAVADRRFVRSQLAAGNSFRRVLDAAESGGTVRQPTWATPAELFAGHDAATVYAHSRGAKAAVEQDLASAREEIAILWPRSFNQNVHFSPAALRQIDATRIRTFISGGRKEFFEMGLKNARIWDMRRPKFPYGIVTIDRKRIWVWPDPEDVNGPVVNLNASGTTKLLYGLWRVVPDDEIQTKTLEEQLEAEQSPYGNCPKCGQAMYPERSRYGAYLLCACGYTKNMTEGVATNLARLMQIVCDHCGGQMIGRRGRGGVFLGCSNYPDCKNTRDLRDLV